MQALADPWMSQGRTKFFRKRKVSYFGVRYKIVQKAERIENEMKKDSA